MKTVTVANFHKDKHHPIIVRTVAKILSRSNVVEPVDVPMEMGDLTKQYDQTQNPEPGFRQNHSNRGLTVCNEPIYKKFESQSI